MDPSYKPKYPILDVGPDTTAQQVLDAVWEHLRKQGRRARASTANYSPCTNRGHGGTACAVACLMSDEMVTEAWMWAGWGFSGREGRERVPHLGRHNQLLLDLQRAHDSSLGPEALSRELLGTARKHGLRPSSPITQWAVHSVTEESKCE